MPDTSSVLTLALETSPNQLDPALTVDVAEGQICALIFEGLVRFSPDGRIAPAAASSWEIEDEGLRYVFRLDPGARFSNGAPVRAQHVISSFQRVLAPDSRSSRGWVLERISGAREYGAGTVTFIRGLAAPDDSTVVVELTEPFGPFLQMLAMPAACIVTADDAVPGGLRGSGPWQLAEWARGDYILLEPNPHGDAAASGLEGIRFRIIPEAFTQIAEFEAGSLDILEIPQAELARFLEDKRFAGRIQSRPELRVLYIGLNNARGPLADVRVRKALNMAVDVDRLIEVLTGGHGERAAGAIPPSLGGFRERAPYPYDPAAATRLLREAGYGDGFAMEVWQRESPEGNRLVEAIQGYLTKVNVEVRIVKREWSAFKEAVSRGKVDAFFLDWFADYPDAENFLFPLFHSSNAGGGGNRAFFADTEVDELIERAQRLTEPDAAEALYARVDSLAYDAAPWIYLYFPTSFVVVSSDVSGYQFPVIYLGQDFTAVRKPAAARR